MELRCRVSVNVRQFLSDLHMCKEELIAYGVSIDDDNYCVTIIHAIPKDLADFASLTLSTAHLIDPNKSIDPDNLICQISEEFNRHQVCTLKTTLGLKSSHCGGVNDVMLAAVPARNGAGAP